MIADDPGRRSDPSDLAAPEGHWAAVGPKMPLRISMITYRWALSCGDIVLNWEDFLAPPVTEAGAQR